jgi:hypothetical protein
MLERHAVKVARAVLRRGGGSNLSSLFDQLRKVICKFFKVPQDLIEPAMDCTPNRAARVMLEHWGNIPARELRRYT